MSHYLNMAKLPGAKAHVWFRVQELDRDTSGLFAGFKDDFLKRVKT